MLLSTCVRAAAEDAGTRRALTTLSSWLGREVDRLGSARPAKPHGVITPAARGRDVDGEPATDGKRVTESLSLVVRRARWKATACRLTLDRRNVDELSSGEREAALAQITVREQSLRTRLTGLPDTSTWMLDIPFGRRVSEDGAFDVDQAAVDRFELVAISYETLALAAETAMELDEAGAFQGGPPAQLLYLMAEAQSALLASLAEAPTRSDSDQRDVFLWLKEQTTRFRIYVDRHMRLDDPADPKAWGDLTERLRKSAREIVEQRKTRRQRGQLLNKLRYHVHRLEEEPDLLVSEVESLSVALERWVEAGFSKSDRQLSELLAGLEERADEEDSDGAAALSALFERLGLGEKAKSASSETASGQPQRTTSRKAAERNAKLIEDVKELLNGRKVVLFAEGLEESERNAIHTELGSEAFEYDKVLLSSSAAERWQVLSARLDSDVVDLFLLGVKLPQDEYQSFKDACLERKRPFVRLPGVAAPAAIAHQITRQVGWRLREVRDEASR